MYSPAPTVATLPRSELALFSQECSPECRRISSSTRHFAWLVHIAPATIATPWVSLLDCAEDTFASHQLGRAAHTRDPEDSCRSKRMSETKCSVSD